MTLDISTEDPRAPEVEALLRAHLTFARFVTPPDDVHALDVSGLLDPAVTLLGARRHGELLGVGALRMLEDGHAELKSMHTVEAARGHGIGRVLVGHLLSLAVDRHCTRVSLETGTMDAFAPARALYARIGFVVCEPFGDYTVNPNSVCMTIDLSRGRPGTGSRR
ncbi:MAG: GNAT family N-acetyltransferase [Acidimicrobiales bacterium]